MLVGVVAVRDRKRWKSGHLYLRIPAREID